MKKKNWKLFRWAIMHLKIDGSDNPNVIYKKCLRNDILLKIMDLSGVTPEDAPFAYSCINPKVEIEV